MSSYGLFIHTQHPTHKKGEKVRRKSVEGLQKIISIVNLFLWIWFPLPIVNTWIISPNIWVGIIIGLCIAIPGCIMLYLGIKAAGSETLSPSKDTEMYKGVYKYIRHPQSVGEFPLFVTLSFALNSWFLVIISSILIVIYFPIMIYYEENDLIERFGDKYREYQKNTGAIFPKIRK